MIMEEDFKTTRTCNYNILKDEFWNSPRCLRHFARKVPNLRLWAEQAQTKWWFKIFRLLIFENLVSLKPPRLINNTSYFMLRILHLKEAGLIDEWVMSWYVPITSSRCMNTYQQDVTRRLSVSNLSSAFVILVAGYILCLATLFFEKIFSLLSPESC